MMVLISITITISYCLKDIVIEQWYITELRFGGETAKRKAAEVLGGVKSVRAIPYLVGIFRDDPGITQLRLSNGTPHMHWICSALTAIGAKGVPELIQNMEQDASIVIAHISGPNTFPKIEFENTPVERAWCVVRMGVEALTNMKDSIVPILLASIESGTIGQKLLGVMALEAIVPKGSDSIPALIASVADKHGLVRYYSVLAIGKIGMKAIAAVEALRALVEDTDEDSMIRLEAAVALGNCGLDSDKAFAINFLNSAINRGNTKFKYLAEDALKRVGNN